MSKLIVEVCQIDSVRHHENADKLDICVVKGWEVVVGRDQYKAGDVAVYIPISSIIPQELSDRYDFTKYLQKGRVRSARLRGHPSHGVLIPNEKNWAIGTDVAEHYGITKYVPPLPPTMGAKSEQEPEDPLFFRYTDIENMRHYPNVLVDGAEVVCTEKIHGGNVRNAILFGVEVAGSHRVQRRMPMKPKIVPWYQRLWNKILHIQPMVKDEEAMATNPYWFPWTIPAVADMLRGLSTKNESSRNVIMYGEIHGGNIQKGVRYGSPDKIAYRAFDINIDGQYLDYDEFEKLCNSYGVPIAPVLYRGPFSLEKIKEVAEGKTTIGDDSHIREGTVVRPIKERHSPKIGRCILKYVGDGFLTAKDIGDYEDQ